MHIAEGVLSPLVWGSGAAIAAVGIGVGVRKLSESRLVLAGVLAAAFFVGSLVHVPVGLGNAHLLMTGLIGTLLGWASIPVIFSALLLQAVLFQYGGLTTLGVNTCTMGGAAVAAWYIFRALRALLPSRIAVTAAGFIAGGASVAIAGLLTAGALALSAEEFRAAAIALLLAHIPIMIVEGVITGFTVGFIARYKPTMLSPAQAAQNMAGDAL